VGPQFRVHPQHWGLKSEEWTGLRGRNLRGGILRGVLNHRQYVKQCPCLGFRAQAHDFAALFFCLSHYRRIIFTIKDLIVLYWLYICAGVRMRGVMNAAHSEAPGVRVGRVIHVL
jgi:hypothetical protein